MNRKIKFRFWHTGLKKMLYPPKSVDSTLHCRDNKGDVVGDYLALMSWDATWYESGTLQFGVFQQFTGLQDKVGKEIYEGDILEYLKPNGENVEYECRHNCNLKVVWYDNFCWAGQWGSCDNNVWFFNSDFNFDYVKVIGNNYEQTNKI